VQGNCSIFNEAVTIGKAAAVVAASVFRFSEMSIPEVKRYLKRRAIAAKT